MPKLPRLRRHHLDNPQKTLELAHLYFLNQLCHFGPFKPLRRALTPIREPEKWVFIVGCYNSGTTLLQEIINQHPSVSILVEGVFCTDQLVTPEELGWPRMWHKVLDEVHLDADDQSVDVQALKKDWSLFFESKKSIHLEKSIVNSARMGWLQHNFPNSYFIYIVRNGYAVAEGIQRKVSTARKWRPPQEFGETYPIGLCAEQWVINNQIIQQDSQKIQNFLKVSYEDICQYPKKNIERIWDFLDLDVPDNSFDTTTKWKIQEKNAPLQNMNQRSIDRLTHEQIVEIEKVASDTLQAYGYPLLSQQWV